MSTDDILDSVEQAVRMAIQAGVADLLERTGGKEGYAALTRAYDEAPKIAQYATTSNSWRELAELVAELSRLRARETQLRALSDSLEHLARKYEKNHLANHGRGVLHARRELLAVLDAEDQP